MDARKLNADAKSIKFFVFSSMHILPLVVTIPSGIRSSGLNIPGSTKQQPAFYVQSESDLQGIGGGFFVASPRQ